jgi:hypothetical protein
MKTFLISLKAEFLKIRRSSALWLVLIAGAFLPIIQFIMYTTKPKEFMARFGHDPWFGHVNMGFQAASFFLWPMSIILVASLVTQIEYRNNTWKQVMASPLRVGDVYFTKFIVIQCMIIASYFLFDAWMLVSALSAQVFEPDFHFTSSPLHFDHILLLDVKSYVAILGMTTIQYCISLRFKNFIGAVGIGLALIIGGLMMIPWDKVVYFPYSYSALSFMRNGAKSYGLLKHEYYSLYYFGFFLLFGYADFAWFRKERG